MIMRYLDYIEDYSYDELPPEAQAEISREAYAEHRALVLAMTTVGREPMLPPRLQTAFRQASGSSATGKTIGIRWSWLAAAGWLLFLLTAAQLLRPEPEPQIVYQEVVGPSPEPVIIERERVDTFLVTKEVVRYVIDTLFLAAETLAPRIVTVVDTVYLPAENEQADLINVSRSLRGKESVLELLVGTD